MRAFAAPLLLLLAACAHQPAAPVATPVAGTLNLDFEDGAGERGRPVGWVGGGEGYDVGVDTEVVHGGSGSGRIAARERSLTDKQAAPLVQWVPAGPLRGKRVRLSGWLRTSEVGSGWGGLWMRVDAETKPGLAFDNMPSRGPRGTTEWRRYEVVLDVAEEAYEIYFGAVLAGNGTLWADDLALEVVPVSVPVTGGNP